MCIFLLFPFLIFIPFYCGASCLFHHQQREKCSCVCDVRVLLLLFSSWIFTAVISFRQHILLASNHVSSIYLLRLCVVCVSARIAVCLNRVHILPAEYVHINSVHFVWFLFLAMSLSFTHSSHLYRLHIFFSLLCYPCSAAWVHLSFARPFPRCPSGVSVQLAIFQFRFVSFASSDNLLLILCNVELDALDYIHVCAITHILFT